MPNQVAACQGAVANPKTIGIATQPSTARTRAWLNQFIISASGTPADNALLWTLQRTTAAGTTTAITPSPTDMADTATLSAGQNATVEPTYTASVILFQNAVNQRATLAIVYAPDRERVIPLTNSAGLGMKAAHASYTGNAECTMEWRE